MAIGASMNNNCCGSWGYYGGGWGCNWHGGTTVYRNNVYVSRSNTFYGNNRYRNNAYYNNGSRNNYNRNGNNRVNGGNNKAAWNSGNRNSGNTVNKGGNTVNVNGDVNVGGNKNRPRATITTTIVRETTRATIGLGTTTTRGTVQATTLQATGPTTTGLQPIVDMAARRRPATPVRWADTSRAAMRVRTRIAAGKAWVVPARSPLPVRHLLRRVAAAASTSALFGEADGFGI